MTAPGAKPIRCWPPGSGRGFTLLEVMLVVLIAGLMAGIAWPRYAASLAEYRADAAARRFAADLNLVKSHARLTSASQTLVVASVSTYTLPGLRPLDGSAGTYAVDLSSDHYASTLTLPPSIVSVGGTVRFDAMGSPAVPGSIIIRSGPARRTVTIDAAGHITITRP
ncbi:GspH/FimT family pseudopilin [Leptolyngbya sp. 15MV]|nr:GspH/FimT family pseudopilin [Leptolyngbya sp. 15MV]